MNKNQDAREQITERMRRWTRRAVLLHNWQQKSRPITLLRTEPGWGASPSWNIWQTALINHCIADHWGSVDWSKCLLNCLQNGIWTLKDPHDEFILEGKVYLLKLLPNIENWENYGKLYCTHLCLWALHNPFRIIETASTSPLKQPFQPFASLCCFGAFNIYNLCIPYRLSPTQFQPDLDGHDATSHRHLYYCNIL